MNNFGPNVLYRNNGDGSFADVTKVAGAAGAGQVGAGACFLDMEGDGDLDLYVANYLEFAYERHRTAQIGGHRVYQAPVHYRPLPDQLYRNHGDGSFTDVSRAAGIAAHAGWGMGMVCVDYDADGDTDIFVGNDVAENFLFNNNGKGVFTEVGLDTGTAYTADGSPSASMGVDCGDYDNDGDVDVVILNSRAGPTLLRNDSPKAGRWLQLRLRGHRTNRSAIGARVIVQAGDLRLVDEVHSGRGYQSHYGERLHFGLGQHEDVDRIEVKWIGGGRDVFADIPADQLITLVEGQVN